MTRRRDALDQLPRCRAWRSDPDWRVGSVEQRQIGLQRRARASAQPLLLATGQRGRLARATIGQPDACQRLDGAPRPFGARHSAQPQRDAQVSRAPKGAAGRPLEHHHHRGPRAAQRTCHAACARPRGARAVQQPQTASSRPEPLAPTSARRLAARQIEGRRAAPSPAEALTVARRDVTSRAPRSGRRHHARRAEGAAFRSAPALGCTAPCTARRRPDR